MLEALGCDVETVRDGEEALSRYMAAHEGDQPFDAVLFDLMIPHGMGGEEAIRQLLKLDPEAKAIVASGYSSHPVIAMHRDHGFQGVLQKPYGLQDLRRALGDLGIEVADLSSRSHGPSHA
jgi:CheY-like chemotaxis protein